jgi:serine/threonine protein kinase
MRTPTWVHDSAEKLSHRQSFINGLPTFDRLKDTLANKVLLSLSDSLENTEISFNRDFQEEGLLGSGAFADVYKVRERDGKVYAVKKSKLQFRSVKERDKMMSEVETMKRLGNCEFIVQLVRAWQEDAHFYVQFDLAERGSVKDLLQDLALKGQDVPERTIWHVAHDTSAGLQHIHSCGMVHLGAYVFLYLYLYRDVTSC